MTLYAPPTARVSDPPEEPLSKPTSLRLAVRCLWLSAAVALVFSVLQIVGDVPTASLAADVATNLITAAVLALVAAKSNSRRGWARWLLAAIFALAALMLTVVAYRLPEVFLLLPEQMGATGLIQIALQTVALGLMFTPASNRWFAAGR